MITYETAYRLAVMGLLVEPIEELLTAEQSLKPHVIKFLIDLNHRSIINFTREGYRIYKVNNTLFSVDVISRNENNAIAIYNRNLKHLLTEPTRCF